MFIVSLADFGFNREIHVVIDNIGALDCDVMVQDSGWFKFMDDSFWLLAAGKSMELSLFYVDDNYIRVKSAIQQ